MTNKMIAFLNKHVINFEGSTKPLGLVRIGLVCLIWTRWAEDFLPLKLAYRGGTWEQALLGVPFFIATFLMLIGFKTQLATAVTGASLALTYYHLGFGLGIEPYTHHHTYVLMIMTCLLALTPCGRSYSLDRFLQMQQSGATHAPPSERGPLWATRLMVLQISLIYFWSAFSKTNIAFLSGDRMEQIFMYLYLGSDYPQFVLFRPLMIMLSIGSVALEYFLAFGLWIDRLRKPLLICGIAFHLSLYILLPVGTFSLTMCLLYLIILPPDKVAHTLDLLHNGPQRKTRH